MWWGSHWLPDSSLRRGLGSFRPRIDMDNLLFFVAQLSKTA
ncbi:hypothetical protein Celaphus_00000329 [Cervus elaphus hippelaphus]|uniref:Uncharacterized protein n=1 Tax=Cervus elaphus hippelaphus TaxID=46360 RepID=A0A212D775_CEREH|nr:hypothetical protein Celaphus_00000329 [Cervus elaphus hippelaphus]